MSAEYPHNAAWQHAQEQPDPALPPYRLLVSLSGQPSPSLQPS